MSERETELQIYCALLARDPLPQQRFTELAERFEQIAHLACAAARQFETAQIIWKEDEESASAAAAKLWDVRAIAELKSTRQPKNLIGADAQETLPRSQGDLLGEMRQ